MTRQLHMIGFYWAFTLVLGLFASTLLLPVEKFQSLSSMLNLQQCLLSMGTQALVLSF